MLSRLQKAIRQTGLTSDIDAPLAVTGRLAQTIFLALQETHPKVAENLTDTLHELTDPEACDLLFQGRGFTYFHVIQYLYAFANTHTNGQLSLDFQSNPKPTCSASPNCSLPHCLRRMTTATSAYSFRRFLR